MSPDPSIEVPEGFRRFDGAIAAAPEPWPEIDASLLEDGRAAVPPFPLSFLPQAWERWMADTAQSTGAPADYVAQGVLAAVAALSGVGVSVRVSSTWQQPLVLWQALVGMPSSGKSPALAAVRRLLAVIEDALRAQDAFRRGSHDAAVERARLLTDQWKERCAAAHAKGEAMPEKPEAALYDEAFVPTQIMVADSTMEALADVVAGNPRGVVLFRDELTAWFANQGRYANGGSDRAHWLEAWGAEPITINRRNRGQPLHLKHFPVSIVGTIQPDRIAEAFAGGDDGLAARFLFGWPEGPDYTPLMDRRVPDDGQALVMLQRIAHIVGPADSPLVLPFDAEAVLLFDHFHAGLHREARDAEGLEAGWLGKGPGTVVRLAGVLALLAWSEREPTGLPPQAIDRETVQFAIGLWSHYFKAHARKVFHQAGRSDRDRAARRVVRWLQTTATTELGREQVRREALAHAVDAEGADRVIARLAQGGVLRLLPPPKGRGRPARRWQANPAVTS
jgi:hypothetical protein